MKNFIKKLMVGGMMAVVILGGVRAAVAARESDSGNSPCFCETIKADGTYKYGCYSIRETKEECNGWKPAKPVAGETSQCIWQNTTSSCEALLVALENKLAETNGKPSSESKLIPAECLTDKLDPKCADVSIFLLMLIQITNYLFSIIGAVALAVFVYGGVLMVISQGNSEKTKKGMETLMAAFIGLIVAFAGYMLINFLAGALGVVKEFRL